ncbi:MAG: ring-cleaving dioxygenase [Anaerolineales bacterium]
MQLTGLHHVTAITASAAENVEFYTQLLGLRLVKKSVNQDDVSAYHFFYADAVGSPGTDITFFDWEHIPQARKGAGTISEIALRVPNIQSLSWWEKRLSAAHIDHTGIVESSEQNLIRFSDTEGQALALVDDRDAAGGGIPWEHSPVPVEHAVRGMYSVTLTVRALEPTTAVLTEVLGFRPIKEITSTNGKNHTHIIFETGPGGPGAQIRVEVAPDLPPGRQGWGGVHHIAFRTPDAEEQINWRKRILQAGMQVTDVIDRYYFKSIYFREPGGILYEIATDGPGFTADEHIDHLGERLALPPFLEPEREQIEANLKPI